MESELFDLYERHGFLNIEVGHNQNADWCLQVIDRKVTDTKKSVIVTVQDCDRKKVFAKAYDLLTDYLSENYGGY